MAMHDANHSGRGLRGRGLKGLLQGCTGVLHVSASGEGYFIFKMDDSNTCGVAYIMFTIIFLGYSIKLTNT